MLGVVVALKPSAIAKSRLAGLPNPMRSRLALSMALDTLTALTSVPARVLVVTDDPTLPGILTGAGIAADLLPEPQPSGMNAALAAGDQALREAGCRQVLACVGDLPALTPDAVRVVLAAVSDRGRAFVADATGVGTTMLIATGEPLDPRFQGTSARAHQASGARPITDDLLSRPVPEARTDVDDLAALHEVIGMGVGPRTARLVDRDRMSIADYQPVTVAAGADPTGYPVITASGVRLRLPAELLDSRIRFLRPGQRLHASLVGGTLSSAWL